MREWLSETHGPTFELFRHFLRRFFDSDLVTSPGQTAAALIGSSTMFLTWFPFVTGPLKDKYAHLAALSDPRPYRMALRADELWLMVLTMSLIGLLTAIQWQSLFPTLGDYRAIGWMPVRTRHIFGAKLLALLTVASGAVLVIDLLPAVGLPALAHAPATGFLVALVAASYFSFFALVALQGLLLNVLRPRAFRRVAGTLQGVLAAGMLASIMLSFSIGPPFANRVAHWFPPVWFLGLCDASLAPLGNRAVTALAIAAGSVLVAYTVSYRRHRALTMEGTAPVPSRARKQAGPFFDFLVRDPRQQAVMEFLAGGFARSGTHWMILMGYLGFGAGVFLLQPAHRPVERFMYGQVILLTFCFLALRHLFSIPLEPRANWMFRMTEGEGRREWQQAVDRLVLACLAAGFVVVLPWEVWLLGWRGIEVAVLCAAYGLVCYEVVFAGWDKLPYTCSYLPGKRPMWMVALSLMGLLVGLALIDAALVECLDYVVLYAAAAVGLLAGWAWMYRSRRDAWREGRLRYEDEPDPTIQGMHLLR